MSICKNCTSFFVGKFCHACGQAATANNRLETVALSKEVFHSTFHTGGGMTKTVRLLLIKPQQVLHGYLDGQRKIYFSPIKLFLVCSVIYLTVNIFVDDHDRSVVKVPLEELIATHKYFFIFGSILISAALNRVIFCRRKFNYAEHVVVAMYVYSFIYIFMSAAMILMFWSGLKLIWYAMLIAAGYYVYAMTRFYRGGNILLKIAVSAIIYILTWILFLIPLLYYVIRSTKQL